jgi:hypothetical protein
MIDLLDIQPNAHVATLARRTLTFDTLDSMRVLLSTLETHAYLPQAIVAPSLAATDALVRCLELEVDDIDLITSDIYTWYFRALDMLEAADFDSLSVHVAALPSLARPSFTAALRARILLSGSSSESGALRRDRGTAPVDPLEALSGMPLDPRMNGQSLDTGDDSLIRIPGPTDIPLKQSGASLAWQIAKYERNLSGVDGYKPGWRLIEPARLRAGGDLATYPKRIAEALLLVNQHWPELHDEISVLTRAITLLEGLPFVGGSDIASFGTSFFGQCEHFSVLAWADHLIHEAAHQRIQATFEVNPALRNSDMIGAPSPIRSDPRPLGGTFHATFVFLRLTQFMARVVREHSSQDAITRLHRHFFGFQEGMRVLETHAEFTDRGGQFFSAMRVELKRLRQVLPEPDPCLYNRIACDYVAPSHLSSTRHD